MRRNKQGHKLTIEEAVQIYKLRKSRLSQREVGELFDVHQTTVGDIWSGEYWMEAVNRALAEEEAESAVGEGATP